MKVWLRARFSTERGARETIAVGAAIAGLVGFVLVLAGLGLGG